MGYEPTWEQKLALDTKGNNILVSAGAGSGKTRVLTERILNYVKSGIDIDKLLVLTFTKNAAAEMKSRIRKGLLNDESLKDQLLKIETAPITNFDSFSLSFVKKYYYLLNIDKNLSIGDNSFFLKKTRDFLRIIFDEYYSSNNKEFYYIIKSNGEKDDVDIFDSIISMYSKLSLKSNFKEYLDELKNNDFKLKDDELLYNDFMNSVIMYIHKIRDIYYELGDFNHYLEKNKLSELIELEEYDDIKQYFEKYPKFVTQPKNFIYKDLHQEMKAIYSDLKNILVYKDKCELVESLTYSSKHALFFYDTLIRLDNMLMSYKKEINTYEFIDIAKMAIRILKENPIIRQDNINKYYEILVDEYQDTSDLQEEFINLLANDNVYMVGDIKQSIYRFRNANCDIFKQKYLNFDLKNGGVKIDMTYNFRSRSGVINTINDMFDKLMNLEYGGADYFKSHHMSAANKEFMTKGKKDIDDSLVILRYNKDDIDKKYKRMSHEALIIANDIKDKIINKYEVYDSKLHAMRPVTYKDFAIISATNTHFALFKEVFDSLDVPLQVYQNESISSSSFLLVINNLLLLYKYIYLKQTFTPDFKHSFMSVGRSLLCDYTDQELFDIVSKCEYYSTDVYKKIVDVIYNYSDNSNINIFNALLEKFDVYNKLTRDYGVKEANTTIEFIIGKILALESANLSFIEFTDYISCLIDKEYKMEYEGVLEESDSVVLMNIHKSKGLEFKIIYYFDLKHGFNMQDLKKHYNFDENYGFLINYNGDSPLRNIANYYQRKEEVSEKIRLFYVALTRAEESMIFVTSCDFEKENESDKINDNSFQDFLLRLTPYFINRKCIKDVSIDYPTDFLNDKIIDNDEESFRLEMENVVIDSKTIEKGHASNVIKQIIDKNTYRLLNDGSKFHEILESLDLQNPNFEGINPFYIKKIKAFLNQVNLKNANIYQEHEFISVINGEEIHGIIDLLVEYDDNIIIIDYKLSNADEKKYRKQLSIYKNYINCVSNKPCRTYLYSLIKEELVEVVF